MILAAARVVTPDRTHEPGWVEVLGERLGEVGAGTPPHEADVELGQATLVPGFVDGHVHGGGGASFGDETDGALERVIGAHRAHGTTTMVASLVTDTVDRLASALGRLAPAVADGSLAGVHLEGPWLSARHAGAHDPGLLRDPTARDVDRLLTAGAGAVRMVTVAPELPGGLQAVRRLAAAGVLAAVGHTHATYDETRAALDAGARVGTHLFNAMRPLRHREPGPVTALLEDPGAVVELVADGVHLAPATVRAVFDLVGAGSIALVTDAMAAAGMPDGRYELGQVRVRVADGVARLADGDAIAGGTAHLLDVVRGTVAGGVGLVDAVRAASATPAAVLGRPDLGALEAGRRADVVVTDDGLAVLGVMVAGEWVDQA